VDVLLRTSATEPFEQDQERGRFATHLRHRTIRARSRAWTFRYAPPPQNHSSKIKSVDVLLRTSATEPFEQDQERGRFATHLRHRTIRARSRAWTFRYAPPPQNHSSKIKNVDVSLRASATEPFERHIMAEYRQCARTARRDTKEIKPPLPPPRGIPQPRALAGWSRERSRLCKCSIVFLSALGGRGFCFETPRLQRGKAFYFFVKIHAPEVKGIFDVPDQRRVPAVAQVSHRLKKCKHWLSAPRGACARSAQSAGVTPRGQSHEHACIFSLRSAGCR
jgi:hypothetical protein